MEVTIRPLREDDAYTSVKWRNDPEVFKYTGNTYDHEIFLETELEWIRRVVANSNEYRCAIEVDGVYVGNIYLTDIENGSAEYHIFIGDKNYWGKGVAFNASRLIIEYGFFELGLQKIKLSVRTLNVKALNLYRKLGFSVINSANDWINMELKNNI